MHAGGVLGVVCVIDINASAVSAPAADRLALHQTTGNTQCSAVHSCGAGDQHCTLGWWCHNMGTGL